MTSRDSDDVIMTSLLWGSLHQYLSSLKVSLQSLFGNIAKQRVTILSSEKYKKTNNKKNFSKNKSCFAALRYETDNKDKTVIIAIYRDISR